MSSFTQILPNTRGFPPEQHNTSVAGRVINGRDRGSGAHACRGSPHGVDTVLNGAELCQSVISNIRPS